MKNLLLLIMIGIYTPTVYADSFGFQFLSHKGVNSKITPLYGDSCGECHFAYQAGLLPARSWKKMMLPAALEDHFGENAELDEEDRLSVLQYLVDHAADTSSGFFYKRSRKINRSIPEGEAPLRISETKYLKRKHREMTDKFVKNNPKVKSIINCQACHRSAEKGIFDDDTILIPNFGYWSELED